MVLFNCKGEIYQIFCENKNFLKIELKMKFFDLINFGCLLQFFFANFCDVYRPIILFLKFSTQRRFDAPVMNFFCLIFGAEIFFRCWDTLGFFFRVFSSRGLAKIFVGGRGGEG